MKQRIPFLKNPLLVADIGGTNANFGIIDTKDGHYTLRATYQLPSQQIGDFTLFMQDLLERIVQEHHIRFSALVIGFAGPLCGPQHRVKPTNLPFFIDLADLRKKTAIQEIISINDFVAVALGYPWVENTLALTPHHPIKKAPQAFIGAGTGLGQAYNICSEAAGCYLPLASEGGHTEFVIYDQLDEKIASFIHEKTPQPTPVTWEQVLSGNGIQHIYAFLGTQKEYRATAISKEIELHHFQPDFISQYAEHDERCNEVFRIYRTYYARYAKQVALQAVACGVLYIAGGIAAKNKKLFLDPEFLRIFTDHPTHRALLEKIPLFIIQDYQVSLYGCAHYYTLYTQNLIS